MDANTLSKAMGIPLARAQLWAEPLTVALIGAQIDTRLRVCAFLAQIGHESNGLQFLEENLNYSADGLLKTWPSRFTAGSAADAARNPEKIANIVYANRMGNSTPGDGWKYRGRGPIQITGKSNYLSCGKALGVDLLANPDLIKQPGYAARSAAWFWESNGLNALADADRFTDITRKINGGTNGLEDRKKRYALALSVIK